MLKSPKLFITYKEFLYTLLIFISVLSIRFGFLYNDYNSFISKPFYFTTVDVLQQYKKDKKKYITLLVYSSSLNLEFFTTTYKELNFLDKKVRLKLFPSNDMDFIDYLTTSYIKSTINWVKKRPKTIKSALLEEIARQHNQDIIVQFYQAIFLAKPISKKLRVQISKLGISHLIALSGFHLAILSSILFAIFNPIYRFFQQRYFPYRYNLIDIGFTILIILALFVYFVNSPASLLRSYIMMVIGWIALISGIRVISFSFLVTAIMVIFIIFPKLLLSLAFWFSIAGVFYIYLLIERFNINNRLLMTIFISFSIFILMLPIVHTIFSITATTQLYSPLLSLLFSIFYPISILLHIIGFGNLFDGLLEQLFSLDNHFIEIKIAPIYLLGYISLSIGAIFSKWIFYTLFLVATLFMGYMFILFMI
jgi:competence protein ComEC